MITEIISLYVASYLVNGCASQKYKGRGTNILEILKDAKFINKDKEEINSNDFFNEKTEVIGLYFSAHWCPPCRKFTPKLAKLYEADGKKFKVVFVSSDKTQEDFDKYLKDMPWYALEYKNSDLKNILSNIFEIKGIPALLLFDSDGKLLSKEGRMIIGKVNQGTGSMSIIEQIHKILEEEKEKKKTIKSLIDKYSSEEGKSKLENEYEKTENGVLYKITVEEKNEDETPKKGQTVTVKIDYGYSPSRKYGFGILQQWKIGNPPELFILIEEVIMLLNKGSKATLIIPPEPDGDGKLRHKSQTVFLTVELVEFQ